MYQGIRPARQKKPNILYRLRIGLFCTETGNAGAQAALQLIVEAGALEITVDFQIAGSQHVIFIDKLQGPTSVTGRKIGAEVERAVLFDAACYKDARIGLPDGQFQVREAFVILEMDVVSRLMFFDKRRFQYKSFDFTVGYNIFKITYFGYKVLCFGIGGAACLKIGPDTRTQGAGFSDIDYRSPGISEYIYTGVGR